MGNSGVASWRGSDGHITFIQVITEPYHQYAVHGPADDRLRVRMSTRDYDEAVKPGIVENRLPMWIIAA